jgi:cobalt-zinc-cadmium efflux system outer membrane protein
LVTTAREFPNPILSLGYSKAIPRYHVELDQPLEYPWVRRARIQAARVAVGAASGLLQAERAAVRHDVEVAYIRAAAAAAVVRLSTRNARDAERLLATVRARREAGDASELDVRLAAITAGQLANTALGDSALAVEALLTLQSLIGLPTDRVEIMLADSLEALSLAPAPIPAPPAGPLLVTAAQLSLQAAQGQFVFERLNRIPVPSVRLGFETGDPTGAEPGILPTFGVAVPLPLWNRNRGALAVARANAARAAAQLAQTERATLAATAIAERERAVAAERVRRDRLIAEDAQRVAELSIIAYREGAYPLVTALEAERTARDALRQFINDLAASLTAEAAFTLALTAGVKL